MSSTSKQSTSTRVRGNAESLAQETKKMEEQLLKLKQDLARDQLERSKVQKGGIWRSARKAWQQQASSTNPTVPDPSPKPSQLSDDIHHPPLLSSVARVVSSKSIKKPELYRPETNMPSQIFDKPVYVTKPLNNSVYEELIPSPRTLSPPGNRGTIMGIAGYLDNSPEDDMKENENSNGGGALWGTYDEQESKSSFLEALSAWRKGSSESTSIPLESTTSAIEVQTTGEGNDSRSTKTGPTLPESFILSLKECITGTYFEKLESVIAKQRAERSDAKLL